MLCHAETKFFISSKFVFIMKNRRLISALIILLITRSVFAQFGIRAGVNLANEIKSFSSEDIAAGFSTNNLTGYQIGVVYQVMPEKSGLGGEIGLMISQKGYTFTDSTSLADAVQTGYREMYYLEVPLNFRYRLSLGFLGVYGYGGLYGGYTLKGTTVLESDNTATDMTFGEFIDRVDYGYNLGLGVEFFKKIEIGASWQQGIKNIAVATDNADVSKNKVFSVNITYLF